MSDCTDEILANVFAMDESQLTAFLSALPTDTLRHLEVLLVKAEKNSTRLKRYLDSR